MSDQADSGDANRYGLDSWHDLQAAVEQVTRPMQPELIELRRYLHAHPEPSGDEIETTRSLYHHLIQHEITAKLPTTGRGLIVELADQPDQPVFALRADIDALRIQDEKQTPYRSRHAGLMHACGHDVHSTILVGALRVLRQLHVAGRLPFPLQLRGIFQPAEETCQGAVEMMNDGAIDQVAAMMALHVDPLREVGTVATRPRVMTANCDELLIEIHGQGGHAARPHHTRDPITAAAQFINAVHVQVPRATDSLDTVVVGFGHIQAGTQSNVIPDFVRLTGTLRTLTNPTREATLALLQEIARGIGTATRTEIQITRGTSAPAVNNDPELTQLFGEMLTNDFPSIELEWMDHPSMGGEDFAFYLQQIPGLLVRIGSRQPEQPMHGLHTSQFDVSEKVIPLGVMVMVKMVLRWHLAANLQTA